MTITTDQARQLLDNATPGPWMLNPYGNILQGDVMSGPVTAVIGHMHRIDPDETGNGDLMAAAPDLAQTVIAQAEEIERKKRALRTYGDIIATNTRDLAKATGREDLLDEEGIHDQDIREIAFEMIHEAREAREAGQ